MKRNWGWLVVVGVFVVIGVARGFAWQEARNDDLREQVREANDRAARAGASVTSASPTATSTATPSYPTATPTREVRRITALDLDVGDCIASQLPGPEESVRALYVAPCDNSAATAKVVGAFITAMDGPYPGREFFQNESAVQCVEESDYYFFPSPEGWEMGDRRVFCLLLLTY